MSDFTYYRISAKGRHRANIVRAIENAIVAVGLFAAGFLSANAVGLIFRALGV